MKELPTKEQILDNVFHKECYEESARRILSMKPYHAVLKAMEEYAASRVALLVAALDSIWNAPLPANEREMISWMETARGISKQALSSYTGGAIEEQVCPRCFKGTTELTETAKVCPVCIREEEKWKAGGADTGIEAPDEFVERHLARIKQLQKEAKAKFEAEGADKKEEA